MAQFDRGTEVLCRCPMLARKSKQCREGTATNLVSSLRSEFAETAELMIQPGVATEGETSVLFLLFVRIVM